jgi:hypothetical protein
VGGRALLSDAFDLGVAVALGVGVAHVGRTLLSDAFDLVVDLGADLAVDVEATSVGSNTPVRRFHVGAEVDPSTRTRPPATSL